ncbi:hypothetical protein V8C86DRAFT_2596886 [Haematococcus lacustris]
MERCLWPPWMWAQWMLRHWRHCARAVHALFSLTVAWSPPRNSGASWCSSCPPLLTSLSMVQMALPRQPCTSRCISCLSSPGPAGLISAFGSHLICLHAGRPAPCPSWAGSRCHLNHAGDVHLLTL